MSKYESNEGYIFPGPDGKPAFLCSRPITAGMRFPPESIAIAVRECRARGVSEAQILAWRDSITHDDDKPRIDATCRQYDEDRDAAEREATDNVTRAQAQGTR